MNNRFSGIDLVKTVAIIGVIIIHVTGPKFYLYDVGSSSWLFILIFASLMRASVPLFLMCSGALLLNPEKEMPLKKLYLKNILRIVVAMLFWGMIYKISHLLEAGNVSVGSLWHAFKEILLFNQEYHFYYMHMIILVYIFLPITRLIVKYATKQILEYILAVWFVLGIVYNTLWPFMPVESIGGMVSQWQINLTYCSVGYGILGYYLKTYPQKNSINIISALLGFCIIFFGTYIMSLKTGILNETFLTGTTIGCALLAFGIYGLCLNNANKLSRFNKITESISKASFCIYIIHVLFLNTAMYHGWAGLFVSFHSVLAYVVLIFTLSYITYLILSKIPIVNKWLI
ncbi:MAG: acyltransferase family protein [Clostridia bacterium]|nr:acyltransferase family protein [Clostridia bacterium]